MDRNKTNDLRRRMADAIPSIPKPYMSVYEFLFGKQTKAMKSRIQQVWNFRAASMRDEKIIQNFERMAAEAYDSKR